MSRTVNAPYTVGDGTARIRAPFARCHFKQTPVFFSAERRSKRELGSIDSRYGKTFLGEAGHGMNVTLCDLL